MEEFCPPEVAEMYEFIEKCQKRQGMTFMQAFDLWLDLAPLRGCRVIARDVSDDDCNTSNLPLMTPSDLLTVDEVCTYLGMSRATLYRHDLPGKCKVGGKVRYVKTLVDEWLASNHPQP